MIWAVEEKKSKRLVGMINYFRRDMRERRVEVGWLIRPAMQGKGYMTEAGRALLRYLIDTLEGAPGRGADPAREQAVGGARQAAGISTGGRADPRPLAGRRPMA